MMGMSVLQRLLEADLVEIHDDAEMEKLVAAAALVEKQLTDGKLALAPATLVAMDPQIAPDEPVLDVVYAAVASQWPTVKKRHPDRPVAVLRGVLTQALAAAGESDAAAGVIWATASSYAPHAPLARETEVWAKVLDPIGDRAERAAWAAWSGRGTVNGLDFTPPDLPSAVASTTTLDSTKLAAYLAAAAGPVNGSPAGVKANTKVVDQGYNAGPANPAWAEAFGATASAGISLTVDSSLKAFAKNIDFTPLSDALSRHAKQIANALTEALAPLYSVELRSRALLWRAALYSTSQRQAYRDLGPQLAIVAIAADLAADVPALSPASVDNLVWETTHAVLGTKETSISAFASALTHSDREAAAALLGTGTITAGRKTLASFLRAVTTNGEMAQDVRAELGVQADMEIRMADLARWLFRDLRAERIVAVPARSRGRRK
jgi:hypothetical protein